MQTPGPIHTSFQRVVAMSQACGVDLSTALDRGQIDAAAYTDMVIGCGGCTRGGTCDKLLATKPALPQAPDYCVNRDEFAHLRDLQAV